MSDVMSVRLHLSGVRVRGVLVDSVDRLEVEVESAREWSRCRHCGFRCQRVRLHLQDGTVLVNAKNDYTGSHTGPESWDLLEEKFVTLAARRVDKALRTEIVSATKHLDSIDVSDLTELLASVPLSGS